MRKEIQEIIEEFNFEKVLDVMSYLDWRWNGELPTYGKLMVEAYRLLELAYSECERGKKDFDVSTGGFSADAYYDGGDIKLRLAFVLTSWDNF